MFGQRQVLVCWKRHLWLVCFWNIPFLSQPSYPFCKTSSVLPDLTSNLVSSLSTLLIQIQEYKFKHLLRTFFFNLIYKEWGFFHYHYASNSTQRSESVHKMRTYKSRYIKGYKLSYKSKIMCILWSKFPDWILCKQKMLGWSCKRSLSSGL